MFRNSWMRFTWSKRRYSLVWWRERCRPCLSPNTLGSGTSIPKKRRATHMGNGRIILHTMLLVCTRNFQMQQLAPELIQGSHIMTKSGEAKMQRQSTAKRSEIRWVQSPTIPLTRLLWSIQIALAWVTHESVCWVENSSSTSVQKTSFARGWKTLKAL